jgi:transcriptional regulator GlxA family with amidase domain
MKLMQVEHAVGMIRAHLIECALQDDWSDSRVAEITNAIGAYVRRIAETGAAIASPMDRRLPRETLRHVVRFINDNLDTKLKWDEIAAEVGMERDAFGRRFKLSTGMTPRDYVMRCRLRRAMKLLSRTDRSIVDIALDVGCACQSHFTTMFRKCTGTTPGAFRSAARVARYGAQSRDATAFPFAIASVATLAANPV